MRTTQHIHMVKSTETLIIQGLYFSCSISLPTCAYFFTYNYRWRSTISLSSHL